MPKRKGALRQYIQWEVDLYAVCYHCCTGHCVARNTAHSHESSPYTHEETRNWISPPISGSNCSFQRAFLLCVAALVVELCFVSSGAISVFQSYLLVWKTANNRKYSSFTITSYSNLISPYFFSCVPLWKCKSWLESAVKLKCSN